MVEQLDEGALDLLESTLTQDLERIGGWTKASDTPLGEVIAQQNLARERRSGRKELSRAARSAT
jgi:hypothetical protein